MNVRPEWVGERKEMRWAEWLGTWARLPLFYQGREVLRALGPMNAPSVSEPLTKF